jgi:hypothetical protein
LNTMRKNQLENMLLAQISLNTMRKNHGIQ